ncbi:MAG TPA: hypothetical protein VJ656_11355 [Pyrinomonadaceae bacterium]|nr:hypothetical protein [Pyrinomonadaceae bacterium]
MRRLLPLIALVAVVSVYGSQQKVAISAGFFSGKDYLEMTETERRAHVTGAINGMLVAPFFGAPSENLNWLKTCTGKLSDEQLAVVLANYIKDQPSNLHLQLNVVTFSALRETCRKVQ